MVSSPLMIGNIMKPRWYLVGVAAGFLACVLAGWRVGRLNFYANFVRFHTYINALGGYYPTVNQMRRIVLDTCPRDKILVIVGGNSVFFGAAQNGDDIWTKVLQKKLGGRYCVVNLALPASPPPGQALLVARSLSDSYAKILYISNTYLFGFEPPQLDKAYSYMYWEAYFDGLIKPSPGGMKEAYEAPEWITASRREEALRAIPESREGARLDPWLRYRDLWDFAGYKYLATVPVFREKKLFFLKPRTESPDDFTPPEPPAAREKYFEANRAYGDPFAGRFDSLPRFMTRDASGAWIENDSPAWRELDATIGFCVPQEWRARTLLVFLPWNPWFTKAYMTQEQKERLHAMIGFLDKHYTKAGLNTIWNDDALQQEDFYDAVHLVPSGGEKVADMAAIRIDSMAEKLGYLK